MGFVEKRGGRYRARYRDPAGVQRCDTFTRKGDAERFLREMQVDIERGRWIDPGGAEAAVSVWTEEFLALSRRLSPTTQETYRRDLTKYILPRFGSYRLGHLPADEIENWLNDEVAAGIAPSSVHRHYRTLRRLLQVAVEKQRILANPCDRVQPPRLVTREMVFLSFEEAVDLAEAVTERYRALIYLAVDSGMRWSELVGLRRARLNVRAPQSDGDRAAGPPENRGVAPQGTEDAVICPLHHNLLCHRQPPRRPSRVLRRTWAGRARLHEHRRSPVDLFQLLGQPLHPGAPPGRRQVPVP